MRSPALGLCATGDQAVDFDLSPLSYTQLNTVVRGIEFTAALLPPSR